MPLQAQSSDTARSTFSLYSPKEETGQPRQPPTPVLLAWGWHIPTGEKGKRHPAATECSSPTEGHCPEHAGLATCITEGKRALDPSWILSSVDPLLCSHTSLSFVLLFRPQMRWWKHATGAAACVYHFFLSEWAVMKSNIKEQHQWEVKHYRANPQAPTS